MKHTEPNGGGRTPLFDRLFSKMIDRRIAAYQNDLIAKHCAEVENMYRQMRGWRHDYHNHINTLLALVGDDARTRAYLLKLNEDLTTVDTVVKTGNVMVDAILNSKLSVIRRKKIETKVKVVVPPSLSVSEVDLCAVIGNLLDNAMENAMDPNAPMEESGEGTEVNDNAARDPEKEGTGERGMYRPWIRIYVGMMKENLYLSVTNSVWRAGKTRGGRYVSTKGGEHGFGLARIDRIVKKYGGYVNRQNEEGVFATEVILPGLPCNRPDRASP